MVTANTAFLSLLSLSLNILPTAVAETIYATPHDKFSSSVGVLGCKVNTDRIAYWPASVSCNSICVKLSYNGRSVHLLRIDQSGGAWDVSYDAWNELVCGESARDNPQTGGGYPMEYEDADPSECADLIYTEGGKLPLSASNSINYLSSCMAEGSWVGKNYVLYNVLDSICSWGRDEECTLDLATSNQPSCPHQLGQPVVLSNTPVYDIQYGTGKLMLASSGQVVDAPNDYKSGSAPSPTYQPSTTAKIISSVLQSTFSTRVSTQLQADIGGAPTITKSNELPVSTPIAENVPVTTSPTTVNTPTTTYSPVKVDTTTRDGRFVETSKPSQPTSTPTVSDAALAFWSSIFILPVLEKWGSQ